MGLLEGHRAMVTGGASGMGETTARRMVEEGASVAIFDQHGDAAARVADDIGGHAFEVDVADWDQVSAAVAAAKRAMGGVSILHNNAGVSPSEGLEAMEPDAFRRIIDVYLIGVFHGIKAVAPIMLGSGDGRIVNTASISGVRTSDGEGRRHRADVHRRARIRADDTSKRRLARNHSHLDDTRLSHAHPWDA